MSESDSVEQEATDGISESSGHLENASFDRAESAVESHWTSHGGDAPEHAPVAVHEPEAGDDAASADSTDGGWAPVTAPDGEAMDASGGSSDGSESGQDGGSMS